MTQMNADLKKMLLSLREKASFPLKNRGRMIMKGKKEHRGGASRDENNCTLLNLTIRKKEKPQFSQSPTIPRPLSTSTSPFPIYNPIPRPSDYPECENYFSPVSEGNVARLTSKHFKAREQQSPALCRLPLHPSRFTTPSRGPRTIRSAKILFRPHPTATSPG